MVLRARESLHKLPSSSASSWRWRGMLSLSAVAVFLVGITVGALALGHKDEPPSRTALNGGTAELSFFLSGAPADPKKELAPAKRCC